MTFEERLDQMEVKIHKPAFRKCSLQISKSYIIMPDKVCLSRLMTGRILAAQSRKPEM